MRTIIVKYDIESAQLLFACLRVPFFSIFGVDSHGKHHIDATWATVRLTVDAMVARAKCNNKVSSSAPGNPVCPDISKLVGQ